MKDFFKKLLFGSQRPNRILSGVSGGMMTNYDPGDRAMHLMGLYEREIYPFLRRGIERADTLIDIGANDGYYGLAFAKYKKKELILCEPGLEKEVLRSNLSLNGLQENVDFILIDKFVSGITNDKEISINDLVGNKKKVFILMDIEGAEKNVIDGFDFKTDAEIDWVIETHSLKIEEDIVNALVLHGYRVSIIKNAWWRFIFPEKRPLAHNRWLFATKGRLH